MTTTELTSLFATQQRVRVRFETREKFLQRCIADIQTDFNKQYGPHQQDWDSTLDACELFLQQLQEYLCTRDLLAYECQVLFGNMATAETEQIVNKNADSCGQILADWKESDKETLNEFDEHIANVRSVYRMIGVQEEY